MILHIFALRWRAEATEADQDDALAEVRAFPASIPGIRELHAGTNRSTHGQGYRTVGVLRFADAAALETYLQHPVHQAFVQRVGPLIEAIDLDLEI